MFDDSPFNLFSDAGDPTSAWWHASRELVYTAPGYLVALVGLVLALALARRRGAPAVCVAVALGVYLLVGVACTIARSTLVAGGYRGEPWDDVRLGLDIIAYTFSGAHALALALLVIAALGWRTTVQHAGPAGQPAPHTHHNSIKGTAAMPTINKNLFLGLIFGPYLLQWVLAFIGQLMSVFGNDSIKLTAALVSCFGSLIGIVSIVMACILIYKLWDTIQDGQARTTPGKGVGFLFIPFFNFYWIFVAFLGWAKDFNTYIKDKGVTATSFPEGLALTLCIVSLVSILFIFIPILGLLVGLANAVLAFLYYFKAIDGANAVRTAKGPAPEPTPEPTF